MKIKNNIAYIDWTNLHKWIQNLWEELDYKKFRNWIFEKFWVQKAYIFMWFIETQKPLYNFLEKIWFNLIFKESIVHKWIVKWNADSELVLKSVRDFYENDELWEVVLVTGDWDFSCLIDFLVEKRKFKTILIPNKKFCSYLIRKKTISKTFLSQKIFLDKIKKSDQKEHIAPKKAF